MTRARLLLKNLTRNRLRTTLTVLAIALPMFVFTTARSAVALVNEFLANSEKQMRVAVHDKLTYTTALPLRIRDEIEALAPEGYITAICRTSWFGGRVPGKQTTFASMGVDRDTFPIVYSEFGMTAEDIERFQTERRAAIIGKEIADQMNWKLGDRVTLKSSIPPFAEMEFVIVAIPQELRASWLYFALDYYNEVSEQLTGQPRGVNNFWLKCATPEGRQWALTEIDKHFANSEHETRTEMESTFIASFARSGGDWVGLVWTIGRLIVIVAVMVAFNTMSMAFRERTREIAIMRALGYSAARIIRMVLSEGFLLGLLGGLVAVGPIYLLTSASPIPMPNMPGGIRVTSETAAIGLVVAVLCGVFAAFVPAVLAGRLKVAPALRKVV